MRTIILGFVCTLLMAGSDWPRFRGPNGSGVSPERGLPAEIGRDKGVVWKIKTWKGNSSPVVAGGRLWITGHEGEERFVFCYSAVDGRLLWRRSVPKSRTETANPLNGPTTPSPAVGDGTVFTFIPEFGLVAYDFDGNERWRVPLGPFGGVQGMATSPVYADGKVLLLIDTPEQAYLAAFDAATGKQAWQAERPVGFLGSYATPAVYDPAGAARQVVVAGAVELTGYDLASGKRVWWARGVTNSPATLPLIALESVFTMEPGEGGGAPPFKNMAAQFDKNKNGKIEISELGNKSVNEQIMYRLFRSIDVNSGNGDGIVTPEEYERAFNPAEPGGGLVRTRLNGTGDVSQSNVAWRHAKGLPYVTAPVLYEGIIYVVRDGGIVSTFDPETGRVLGERRLNGALGQYYAQPVAGDGKVYFVNKEGKISVIRAGAEWEMLSSGDVGEQVIATPAIADGRIYLRAEESLYCFGEQAETGGEAAPKKSL
ncbi:MAG: PQQ-binding-like beta-propeller repeat protein [Bryobacteraceae bacterium]|nr:PQQ-binding-like beta-propeller repeat protein [Bryobacteraceae bacterium]